MMPPVAKISQHSKRTQYELLGPKNRHMRPKKRPKKLHAKAGTMRRPAAARCSGGYGGAEVDLDVGTTPVDQDEVQEHLRAGDLGCRRCMHTS